MKRFLLFLLLVVLLPLESMAQREVVSLNRSWTFTYGWQKSLSRTSSEPVNIPHTWNLDALSAKQDYYRGQGNYTHEFTAPLEWQDTKRVYLRFEGVNNRAEVYLNGYRLGEHKGGYTAFGFNITPLLNYGKSNTIWVRVSNSIDLDIMPLVGDFNQYGGIMRDVDLIVTPLAHIVNTEYAATGIKVIPESVSDANASMVVEYQVAGVSGSEAEVKLRLLSAKGMPLDSTSKKVRIGIEGFTTSQWKLNISNPHLWDGVNDPYMYDIEAVVTSQLSSSRTKTTQSDNVTESFGVRYFGVNSNNEFTLNGKPYELRGVTRVEDVAMLGSAMYDEQHRLDVELIQEMGANAVRMMYYPNNKHFVELCDRAGIILWADLPFTGAGDYRDTGFNDSDNFKDNGEMQLLEMIEQYYNSPSVLFWGIFNELNQRSNDPINYVRFLNTVAKEEDPSRLTVAASNQDGALNFVTDLIGFNQYMGWKSGMPDDITAWAEIVRKNWPELKVSLSEYGAGASIYQHESNPAKPKIKSYWHPEEWQTAVHEGYLSSLKGKGFFWGTFACSMFDWGAAHKHQGTRAGISDMGLVTFDRGVKKDAFYLYKANWNKEESFVYIASRRFKVRHNLVEDIKVFSPDKEVILTVNGKELEPVENNGIGVFLFEKCQLQRGRNVIEAESSTGDYDRIVFEVE